MPVIYQPSGRAQEYVMVNGKPGYACNLYKGCAHQCLYCYAPDATFTSREMFFKPVPKENIIERVKVEAPSYADNKEPILICFACDPYQPIEKDLLITRRVLEIFKDHNIYYRILTKGGLLAARDFDIMKRSRCEFGVTVSWTNDRDRAKWEPKASPIEERIESLRVAHQCGIPTWASVEPVILPEQCLALIAALSPYVDMYRVGKLNHHPQIENSIDWHDFGTRAVSILNETGKAYYIKKDLAEFIRQLPRAEPRGME
jgi:DNA repair photolyase